MSGPGRWLRVLSCLVPGDRRDAWLREWHAELCHRDGAGFLERMAPLEDALVLRLRGMRRGAGMGGSGLAGLGSDVRLAARTLRRSPAFAAVVVLTLGVAVGANTAVFSLVRDTLLRPLPYEEPAGLAFLRVSFMPHGHKQYLAASGPEYLELKEEARAFAGVSAYYVSDVNLGGAVEPVRLTGAVVSADYLDVLGVGVRLGRDFLPGEDRPGAGDVALLTHGLWERAFGGDPAVLGSDVLVNDVPTTVVGVLPPDFRFPGADVELLRPLTFDPADPGGRSSHWLYLIGRTGPGVSMAGAAREVEALQERWAAERPGLHQLGGAHPVEVAAMRQTLLGDVRGPLLLLLGAVGLVLLVACVNVANVMVARAEARRREMGVRVALGAGRGALARQHLVESGVLALLGGLLGLGIAAWSVGWLPSLAAGSLPPGTAPSVDGTVLAFSLAVTLGAALAFGVAPAWAASRTEVTAQLEGGGRAGGGGRRALLVRRVLVTGEVAAAVALVAVAAVLTRSFASTVSVDPGFDAEGVVVVDFALSSTSYPTPGDVAAFHRELEGRIAALPGVEAVGGVRTLPLSGGGGWESLYLVDEPLEDREVDATASYQVVSPGWFDAMDVPVVEGRGLDDGDVVGAAPVVVLNETAAKAFFPRGEALGQRVQFGSFPDNPNAVMTVVGVVGDVRQTSLEEDPPPQIFVARDQAALVYGGLGTRFASLVVEADGDPASTLAAVGGVIRELDPNLPLADARTLEDHVTRSMGDRRFVAYLMGGFSVTALLLGALGLYGLLAQVVARRTREIGIRLALGAPRAGVLARVVGEAALLVVVGSAVGIGAALLSGRVLESLVAGAAPGEPWALMVAPLVLLVVGASAAALPARRAASVDPSLALRSE